MEIPNGNSLSVRERANILSWIRLHAYHLGVQDIGRGEEAWSAGGPIRNNDGPFLVEEVRPNDGTGLDADTEGAWCASWVSAKYTIATSHAILFFDIDGLHLPFRTSRSALTLGRRMFPHCEVIDPGDAREGDVFFMERDGGGHTGFCRGPAVDGKLPTLDGNVGKVPALVRPLQRDVGSIMYVLRLR